MKIYSNTATVILDIDVDDNSFCYRSIMGDHKVVLYFSLPESIEIPIGAYIEFQGQRYTLFRPEHLKKNATRNFDYEITFGSSQELLKQFRYKFLSTDPYKLKFPLTATPKTFLKLLVENLNLNDSGWSVGACIDASEKVISFNHDDCFSVLGRIADEFDSEWEIVNKTIHLRKVEYNKQNPLALSYGKGNGFRAGVSRSNNGDRRPVTRLYVQGGERNLDKTEYGSETLRLPKEQMIVFEGRKYQTDKDGMYIQRADKPVNTIVEDSYDGSDFYPLRVGTVSGVETVEGKDNEGNLVTFYDILDRSIPESLDYSDYIMPGEKATIIFQSGRLTGKEFDIVMDDAGKLTGYIHAERRFKLVSNDTEGGRMPNKTFYPEPEDTYAVFHISMPQEYICLDETQEGASWDMFREAVRYMYENEEEVFTFTGELDPIWASQNWLAVGGKILPGGYVLFSDNQFQPEGINIRITGVTDYINRPHQPVIELSNSPVAGFLSNDIKKLQADEVVNEDRFNGAIQYTKRTWKDVKETMDMMFDPEGDYFTELIKPLVTHTAQLIVGTNSQQMDFVGVKFIPNADNNPNLFKNTAGRLEHFTINAEGAVKQWTIGASSHTLLYNYPYYVYAKCQRNGSTGQIIVSTEKIKLEDDPVWYHFWVGVLNTPIDNVRSWQPNYGYTEIAGQQITTGVIKDRLSRLVIDLINGTIYGKVTFAPGSTGYNNLSDKPDVESIKRKANDALTEAENASFAANQAKTDASDAATTAKSKARVFYDTKAPTLGMSANDLWVDGSTIYRYTGSYWAPHSKYDGTLTTINGGLITTGALTVGTLATEGTGGIAGSGKVRIWAGGTMYAGGKEAPSGATFKVYADGVVEAKQSFKLQDGTAGITGFGTDSSSVRFWAGGDMNSAPFRVLKNGKVYAKEIEIDGNNAGISGTGDVRLWIGGSLTNAPFYVKKDGSINATKGKIGDFEISNGWLKCNSNSNSNRDVGYIDMSGSNTRIAFGKDLIPATAGGGYTCTAIISNKNAASTWGGETIALSLESSGGQYNTALTTRGGARILGRISTIEETYWGLGASNSSGSSADNLKFGRWFIVQPSVRTTFYLPSDTAIENLFGYFPSGNAVVDTACITINILMTRYASGDLDVVSPKIDIIDKNGNRLRDNNYYTASNFVMKKGNIVSLTYFNRTWYISSSNYK